LPSARHAGAIRLGDQSGRIDPRKPLGYLDGLWRADAGAVCIGAARFPADDLNARMVE
jgi:hypothetical protein